MKTQKYLITIEMPDGDMISPGWIQELIQADCNVENEGRQKVLVEEIKSEVDLDAIVNEVFDKYSFVDGYGQLVVSFNRAELYSFINKTARKG